MTMDTRGVIALCVIALCGMVASQGDLKTDADANVQIEVKIFPAKSEKEVDIGDSLTLSCTATGDGTTVTWTHDDVEVTETDLNARVHTVKNGNYHQLKLMTIEEDDSGMYKCEGTSSGGMKAEDTIDLIVLVKLEVTSPTEQFGLMGETKVVECVHKGKPAPTVTWKFGNQTAVQTEGRYTLLPAGGLQISDLQKVDEMTYICELMTLSTGDTYLHQVNFAVVGPPTITDMVISPANVVEGSEVTITCTAEADPAPSYQFLKGDGEVLVEDGVQGNVLTLPSVTVADQAKYTCVATNKGGMERKMEMLDVLSEPTLELPQGETYSVVAGDALEVLCVVSGDPQPSVVWAKGGADAEGWTTVDGAITGEAMDVMSVSNSLSIPVVDHTHNGTYTCQGENSVGSVVNTISVEVQYKPNFDAEFNQANVEAMGWEGHTTVLQCQTNANPAVDVITWKMAAMDGSQVEVTLGDGTYTIESFVKEAHLSTSRLSVTVDANSTAAYTDYFCEAVNEHNADAPASHKITLKEAFAPGMPDLKQGDILSMSTTIMASEPADNGGQPVTQFEFESMADGADHGAMETVESQGSDTETAIQVRSLLPGTTYRVKVRAVNHVGSGSWAEMSFITVNVSKPERMTFNSGSEADVYHYDLEWAEIATGGSVVSEVEISWAQVTLKTDGKTVKKVVGEWEKEVIPATLLNESKFTIKDLLPGTDYQVKAKATNGIGTSEEQHLLIKTAPKVSPQPSSASLGSGGVIAIIIALLVIIAIIVIVMVIIVKKKPELLGKLRKGGKGGEEEGLKEGGAAEAEEEKLIQKEDTVKVENEVQEVAPAEVAPTPQEFEPETKPEATPLPPVEPQEVEKPNDDVTEIKVTPETPEDIVKSDTPTAI